VSGDERIARRPAEGVLRAPDADLVVSELLRAG
jgi:hypothetical protein